MKTKLLFIFLIVSGSVQAQDMFLKTGFNHSLFQYKRVSGDRSEGLQSDVGNNYEMGYRFMLADSSRFAYELGLVFNEFNAIVGVPNASLKWKTGYVGLQVTILYPVIYSKSFSVDLKAGGGINTIFYGKQDIKGVVFDLKNNDDFNGALFHFLFGAQANFKASEHFRLSVSYNYVKMINKIQKLEEFYVKSNQIMFGIYISRGKKQVVNTNN